MPRESLIISTLMELADNLVEHFDVIDILTLLSNRCVEALDVDAAGVMLASAGGELEFVASSSESMRVLELFQIPSDEGPCVDCYRTGSPVVSVALGESNERWPRFTPRRSSTASTRCTAFPCDCGDVPLVRSTSFARCRDR